MYLTLPPAYRQPFLQMLCRCARQPLAVTLCGDTFRIGDISAKTVAAILAHGIFPLYEADYLHSMARRELPFFDCSRQAQACTLARNMLQNDIRRDTAASGPGRYSRIAKRLRRQLEQGRCHFTGFCRFALAGHRSYLLYTLELAADELLAAEEDKACTELLRSTVQNPAEGLHLHIFFSSDGLCQIWHKDADHCRPVEGGRIAGREDVLISSILACRPAEVHLHGQAFMPQEMQRLLQDIFGGRLHTEATKDLDKDLRQWYDDKKI